MLILGRQDRWQLTVKINPVWLLPRVAKGSAGSEVNPLLVLMLLHRRGHPPPSRYPDTDFLHHVNHASRVRVCNTVVAVTESGFFFVFFLQHG